MIKQWRLIQEVPNYEVSNYGEVRSILNNKILKPSPNSDGYLQVSLYFGNGGYVKRTIHVLVAKAFLNKPGPEYEVNHEDGDKNNNCVLNLSYTTHLENMQHANKNGLISKIKYVPVQIIETGEVFESQHACARAINGHQTHISAVINGRIKSHRGFTFRKI